mgnify:CR=1 FL=1
MGSLILTIWEGSPGAGGQLEQRNDFVLFGEQNRGLRGWDVGRAEVRGQQRSQWALQVKVGVTAQRGGLEGPGQAASRM